MINVLRSIQSFRLMLRVQWRIVRGGYYPFRDCPLWFVAKEAAYAPTKDTPDIDPYVQRYFLEAAAELALRVYLMVRNGDKDIAKAIKGS
jgi:hypothetical protein